VPRIVLTGGPGGGKTTAADLFRREIGDSVVIVPEAATLLFGGGFPRVGASAGRPGVVEEPPDGWAVLARRAAQQAIYHVQRNLEDTQAARFPHRALLCDRGTVDGAAYWPDGSEGFFEAVGTSLQAELARYDAVLFFETAAAGGLGIEGGNPVRIESLEEALRLDERLVELWSEHPRFVHIPHERSFLHKMAIGVNVLGRLIEG
jgi:hypothetical protein